MTECAVVEKQSATGCYNAARYEAESLSHYGDSLKKYEIYVPLHKKGMCVSNNVKNKLVSI